MNKRIIWVGISDKQGEKLLSPSAISGKIISMVENGFPFIETHKTNLVKYAPVDENGKLRYPTKKEIDESFPALLEEIIAFTPKIVIALGGIVKDSLARNLKINEWEPHENYQNAKYKETIIIAVKHPSYIYVYKRNEIDDYVSMLQNEIMYQLCKKNHCQ